MRRARAGVLTAAIALGSFLLAAPAASAATTIGSDLAPDPVNSACGSACTIGNSAIPGAQVSSPVQGVVVRWRVRADTSGVATELRLTVLRPGSGGTFTGVSKSATQSFSDLFPTTRTYETQQPIAAGDLIALDIVSGDFGNFTVQTTPQMDTTYIRWLPAIADGETSAPDTTFSDFSEVLVNADVEPDCDGDGLGDETQDADIASCTPQPEPPASAPKADGTLTIDANKGKVEKGRKVTLTGQLDVAANESCEPGRQIQIQRRLKSEDDSKFQTFATVQTDAAGNYSTKVKVKKTYFYRAVVAENDACDDETSNSQKVRVQKRKAAQEA